MAIEFESLARRIITFESLVDFPDAAAPSISFFFENGHLIPPEIGGLM